MKETPVNKIMESTLEKMREMVDVSTIIGEPMVTGTTTLIPVHRAVQTVPQSRIRNCSAVQAAAESQSLPLHLSLFRIQRLDLCRLIITHLLLTEQLL